MIKRYSYSNVALSGSGASSLTYAISVPANSKAQLLVFCSDPSGDTITGVTFNGNPMYQAKKQDRGTGGLMSYVYTYDIETYGAVPSGSSNVVISRSGSTATIYSSCIVATYARQTKIPNSTVGASATSAATISPNLVTVTNEGVGIWGWCVFDNGNANASTNLTELNGHANGFSVFEASTFPQVTYGSFTGTMTGSTSNVGAILIGLEPSEVKINYNSQAQSNNNGSTSLTYALNNANGNFLVVGVVDNNGSDANLTGVTYNGVAMTKLTSVQKTASNAFWLSIWYLKNPAKGSNNVVVSRTSGSGDLYSHATTYNGINGYTIDAYATNSQSGAGSTFSQSLTSVFDSCWHVAYILADYGGITAGTNSTIRGTATNTAVAYFDSNGATTPAGSLTLTQNITSNASNKVVGIILTLKPMVLQTGTGVTESDYQNQGSNAACATGFQVPANCSVYGFSYYGSRGNGATSTTDLIVEIRATDGVGTLIKTETFKIYNTTAYNTKGWQDFTFATPVSLTAATQYVLLIKNTAGSTNDEIRWMRDANNPYSGGVFQTIAGGVVTTYSGSDQWFRIYGEKVTVTTVAPTKSLQYAVKSTPSAKTKSLQYAVKITPSAKTKSLQYAVKPTTAITKSLKYCITITPTAPTKSLKYTVTTTPSATTKSLQYTVKPTTAVTKSLKYCVVTVPSAITKSLQYAVKPTTAITKSLKYCVKITPSATTKSLQYEVKVVSSITKSLQYCVKTTPSAVTKSLKYCVVTVPSATTKSLQYAIKPTTAITKSLQYCVKITPSAKTKSLQYEVKVVTSITKSLQYTVKIVPSAKTKSLKYTVVTNSALQLGLSYEVTTSTPITKALKYTVKITPTALTKSLSYEVKVVTAVTKSLQYAVKKPIAITKSLKYVVKITPAGLTKSLQYSIYKPFAITKSLQYEIAEGIPVLITKSLKYGIIKVQRITKSLQYVVLRDVYRKGTNRYGKSNSYAKGTNRYTRF